MKCFNVVSGKIGKILLLLKGNHLTYNLLRTVRDSLLLAYRKLNGAYIKPINKVQSSYSSHDCPAILKD